MSALERGVNDPKLSTLERLAPGVGLTVSELLRGAEREPTGEASPGVPGPVRGLPNPRAVRAVRPRPPTRPRHLLGRRAARLASA